MPILLSPAEARVLGALAEKALTTPDYYPLSLNALTNACNQTSSRDPVVSYSEGQVTEALDGLRDKKLAFQFQGADSRVARYGHRLVESLGLGRPETAVLCVLLLRGPQTVGEVRTRTGRMHEFASLEETEACLGALASRPGEPLVARLPRMSGMKEQRFAHLLCGPVELEAPGAARTHDPDPAPEADERLGRLEREAAALRAEVSDLSRQVSELRKLLE